MKRPSPAVIAASFVVAVLMGTGCQADEGAQSINPIPTVTTATPPSSTPTTAVTSPPSPPSFQSKVDLIDDKTARRMASSWRTGCPVGLGDLRLLTVSHVGFDGRVRAGELVVHAVVAENIVSVFRALFEAQFPIEQMRLVDDFGADDDRSMAANNTSAFNCRRATGSSRWSEHAYGKAIDINPVQNPYVTRSGAVLPPSGSTFVDRDPAATGLIVEDSSVTRAFGDVGWAWGGRWSSGKDYQHFSESGR